MSCCFCRMRNLNREEADMRFVGQQQWQDGEIHAAIQELDAEQTVSHEIIAAWLKSWGTKKGKKAP